MIVLNSSVLSLDPSAPGNCQGVVLLALFHVVLASAQAFFILLT
jgi:hypothetical protein